MHDDKDEKTRFLVIAASSTFAVGLAWAIARTNRKRPPVPFFRANGIMETKDFSPVLHATQALAIGTLLCCGSATAVVMTGRYVLDIHDLPTFGSRMRRLFGTTKPDTNEDIDWDQIWTEGERIDRERKKV